VLLADSPVSIEPRAKRGANPSEASEAPEIRVDANLVQIPVSVVDRSNRPVTGLDKENFRVFENQVEQRVMHLAREDEPLAVGLVFDTSGSMKKKLQKSIAAAEEFFKTANPEDEFFLVEFDGRARLTHPLTANPQEILSQLMQASAHGRTAMLDAIYLGLQQLRKSNKPRKALLVVSDGGDNCSRYTETDVRNLVKETDVMIYAMGVFEPSALHLLPEEVSGPGLLDDITEQTGGRLFAIENINDLPDVASKIGVELRNRYLIAYAPSSLQRDGKYHKVQVKVAAPGRSRAMRVAWRPGYYAPQQ